MYICILYVKLKIMTTYNLDPKKLSSVASKFRAISHPTRIAIIYMLETNKQMNVTQIHTKLNILQAVTSHHLSVLKNKGIVSAKRVGKNTLYSLTPNLIVQIKDCLEKCG
jgi:DNA-binding transcriptional ArsR family regulator